MIMPPCVQGREYKNVAAWLRVNIATVGRWDPRVLDFRPNGLADDPRPGAPRTIIDAKLETVVYKTLQETPEATTHGSTRVMGRTVGLSHSAIIRISKAFVRKPHNDKTYKLSTAPYLDQKVRDVVGFYRIPPQDTIVLSVDEKSQVSALDRIQSLLPMSHG